jgi:hypothetical protein
MPAQSNPTEVEDDPYMRVPHVSDGREESRVKAGAFSTFHVPDSRWREEVACHISKSGKYVASKSARWQKCRSHSLKEWPL